MELKHISRPTSKDMDLTERYKAEYLLFPGFPEHTETQRI